MKIKASQVVGSLIALALFVLAIRVLYKELSHFQYSEIIDNFSNIPKTCVIISCCFTLASYLVLTLYDVLAMRYVGQVLPYYKIAMASFIGYTLSHNLGFPLFTGGAARYRLFSAWGLSNIQIAQAIAFSGVIYWLGFIALGGVVFTIEPPPIPAGFNLSESSLRPLGIVCLLLIIAYLLFSVRNRHIKIKSWEFPAPRTKLSFAGVFVAALDWVLANNVAYFLLPETNLSYFQFLGLFQLGQVAGLLSHVPGGLGVFEATILAFLSDKAPASAIFGSLIAYRIVYYLVPLGCSALLMLTHEAITHGKAFFRKIRNVS